MRSSSGLEDSLATDANEQGKRGDNLELKDFSGSHNGSQYSAPTFDPEFADSHSDEEEKSPNSLRSRRASASTLQSFMLYTPE